MFGGDANILALKAILVQGCMYIQQTAVQVRANLLKLPRPWSLSILLTSGLTPKQDFVYVYKYSVRPVEFLYRQYL